MKLYASFLSNFTSATLTIPMARLRGAEVRKAAIKQVEETAVVEEEKEETPLLLLPVAGAEEECN